jgi:hypothetical protein
VYEYKNQIWPGLTRPFMRHSNVLVQPDANSNTFAAHHVIGTPGVGLTYEYKAGFANPRTETVTLLAMDFVAWIPRARLDRLAQLARRV